jgi:hypothetical protein
MMSTDSIISLLVAEREKLDRAIKALQGTEESFSSADVLIVSRDEPNKKRVVSAAARRRMALGQQKRWAALKAANK